MNGEIEWREGLSLSDLIKQIYRALSLSLSLSDVYSSGGRREGRKGGETDERAHTTQPHGRGRHARAHKQERKSLTFPSLAPSFTNFVTFPFSLLSLSLSLSLVQLSF